jgi:hypothetical protein
MQLRSAYPPNDTVGGCCFITKDEDTSEGIIDLDIYVDSMQPFGRLCVSPKAVRMMAQVLGWEPPDADTLKLNLSLTAEVLMLREQNERLNTAVNRVLDALYKLDEGLVRT